LTRIARAAENQRKDDREDGMAWVAGNPLQLRNFRGASDAASALDR
jgi:hypothetical protein